MTAQQTNVAAKPPGEDHGRDLPACLGDHQFSVLTCISGRLADLPQHVGYVFQNPDHQLFTRRVGVKSSTDGKRGHPTFREEAILEDAGYGRAADKAMRPAVLGKGQGSTGGGG
jgi:hypothetical protein